MKKLLLTLIIFIVFSVIITFTPYFNLDLLISQKIQSISSPIFVNFMWFVSSLGNQPLIVVIVGFISLLLYLFKLQTAALFIPLSVAGSALSGSLIKILINRSRPSSDHVRALVSLSDKSYPSGHVLVFTVLFGFLVYLLIKKIGHKAQAIFLSIILITLIIAIGFSRIYLGAHWASDVLGGYLLGIIWLIFTIKLYNSYHGKR